MAIARAWPVAPSSAARMTATRNGSDRTARSVHERQGPGDDRQGQDHVRADDQPDVAVVRPAPPDPGRDRRDAGPAVLADVAPFVAVEDRRDQHPDRDRQDQRRRRPLAAHRVVGALDHQRPHQQEHDRDAERPVLVLERRRRVAPAADQPEQPEDDDRRAAQPDEIEPDDDREREERGGDQERGPLFHPALDDGVAGPRAGDRVDALPDVVDLVDDVRARVEEDRAEQGRDERRPVPQLVDPGEGRAGEDRDDRRGEGERPKDLVQRPGSAPCALAAGQLPVVGQAQGDRAGSRDPARDGPDRWDTGRAGRPGSTAGAWSGIDA